MISSTLARAPHVAQGRDVINFGKKGAATARGWHAPNSAETLSNHFGGDLSLSKDIGQMARQSNASFEHNARLAR
jgi:hypothetical protein